MNKAGLPYPFEGEHRLTQGFGARPEFYRRWNLKGHNGLDFALPEGTRILAVDAGRVVKASYDANGYGIYIKIRHDWGESLYAHLQQFGIWLGAPVTVGQEIGLSGNSGVSSGPHLHFGLRVAPYDAGDGYFGYRDPSPYLTKPGVNMSERHNGAALPVAGLSEVVDRMDGMDKSNRSDGVDGFDKSSLSFSDYQQAALRTWTPSGDMAADLAYLALSLAGEAGEFANLVKKHWRHGHELDLAKLKDEGGDVFWYLAVIMAVLDIDLADMAAYNIDKLFTRYPDGFSQERSRNRAA